MATEHTTVCMESPGSAACGRREQTIGIGLSAVIGAVLAVAAGGKLAGTKKIKQGFADLGIPDDKIMKMGLVLTACLALYANPRTAVLGAIALTAYLGGAVTANLRAGAPLFTGTLTAVYLGVLMWVGMVLRRPELLEVLGLKH